MEKPSPQRTQKPKGIRIHEQVGKGDQIIGILDVWATDRQTIRKLAKDLLREIR